MNAAKLRAFPRPALERTVAGIDPVVRQAVRALVSGEAPWPLFLCGPPGTGKTCAALCLLDHAAGGGEYFAVPDLCRRMNQAQREGLAWSHEGRGGTWRDSDVWDWIERAPLVVLDEVGCRERVSDAHYETVKGVLDVRERSPLVVLSNLLLVELGQVYDARIVSRLAAGTVVELAGADRRLA